MSAVAEALVVGGGPAGAACAALLANAGRRVALVERTAGPHDKVCGEFLSCEALAALNRLGLDPFSLGALEIDTLRLSTRGRSAEVALPFAAASLSRRVLDEALIGHAVNSGAEVLRGNGVRELSLQGDVWRARLSDGEALEGENAFIATGKHDLRARPRGGGLQSDLIGFKMHWPSTARTRGAFDGTVELVLFPGGYAGIAPASGDRVNLCLLLRRDRFAELGRRWDAVTASVAAASPTAHALFTGAAPCYQRPLAIGAIPFGHLERRAAMAWHLGDQVAVVPSYTGTGISLALHSAYLAADAFLKGSEPLHYHRRLSRAAWRPVVEGTALSTLLVRPSAQAVISQAVLRMPWLMSACAAVTRLPRALAEVPGHSLPESQAPTFQHG